MTPEQKGKKTLVPLTESLYVYAELTDPSKILVDIGTGYYVEKVRTSKQQTELSSTCIVPVVVVGEGRGIDRSCWLSFRSPFVLLSFSFLSPFFLLSFFFISCTRSSPSCLNVSRPKKRLTPFLSEKSSSSQNSCRASKCLPRRSSVNRPVRFMLTLSLSPSLLHSPSHSHIHTLSLSLSHSLHTPANTRTQPWRKHIAFECRRSSSSSSSKKRAKDMHPADE